MSILTRIKELATEKGITIAELERKTNMGNGVIRRWDKHLPTTDKLQKVALELNTTLDYLVNGKETTDEKNCCNRSKSIYINSGTTIYSKHHD